MSKFEFIGNGIKYALQARSPADAKKWVWALKESKSVMSERTKESTKNQSEILYSSSSDFENDQPTEFNLVSEDHCASDVPFTETRDIPTLLHLLDLQFQVQSSIVQESNNELLKSSFESFSRSAPVFTPLCPASIIPKRSAIAVAVSG